jgi:peptidoglycan/LPS O-acetylase OafA/YrhL
MESTNNQPYIYRSLKYFESLNGLRFIAAFLVVMHHSETIRNKYLLPNLQYFSLFQNGRTAVTFFFVLSGFLITFLLLRERDKNGTVSVSNFYVRRILRIWPLYFLLVVIGTILVPFAIKIIHFNYQMPYTFSQVWLYFVLFIPFVVNAIFGHHFLEPLWSIGVEEIFYLMWAPIFRFVKKGIVPILIFLIVISVLLRNIHFSPIADYIINCLLFDSMAIGGLGAWWLFNLKKPIEEVFLFRSVWVQSILLSLLAIFVFSIHEIQNNSIGRVVYWAFTHPVIGSFLVNGLFLYLIVNVSTNSKRIFSLKGKIWDWLGDISYGIYMYHMLFVFGIILLFKNKLQALSLLSGTLLYYSIVTVGVITTAYLSKNLFENQFLKLKGRFEKL